MSELLKLLGQLQKQGFATPEQKAALGAKVKELPEDEQAAAADLVEAAEALPESNEAAAEGVEKGIKALFSKEGARIEKSVKDEITAFLEQHKALAQTKAGVYHPDVAEKRKALNEELREITKALLTNDDSRLKDMSTGVAGSPFTGFTVGSELSAEIRHLITQNGVARREMNPVALTRNEYKANNLVTDVTVFWVDEGAVVGSTQTVLGQEVLTLKKLGAIVTMTNELITDMEIDLISFVASRVAEQMARAEDLAFFDGDGTAAFGGFTGLLRHAAVNTVTMAATRTNFNQVTADDLLDMIDATPVGALANGKFYYHRTIKGLIRRLKDTTNNYIYQAPSQTGPATVWGHPEVLVEAMPARTATAVSRAFILFGDLRQACIFGYKNGIEFARFDAGLVRNVANSADINLITTDRQAIRWTQRVGYIRVIPTAVTRLRTAAA